MGTKILFFGGFGPVEDTETDTSEPDQAQFGWFNDLVSFDTGTLHTSTYPPVQRRQSSH